MRFEVLALVVGITRHLAYVAQSQQLRHLFIICGDERLCDLAQGLVPLRRERRSRVFRKGVGHQDPIRARGPIGDDRTEAAALAASRPRQALLKEPAAKIGLSGAEGLCQDLPSRFAQRGIRKPFLAQEFRDL